MFRTFECLGQNYSNSSCQWQVNSSSNFASFFIVMTLLCKFQAQSFSTFLESHQSPNFETFKCTGEDLPYSLRHFPNNRSVFLQILHSSLVSEKITPLALYLPNVIYFAQKEQIQVKILRILNTYFKIHQILVSFETTNQFFFSN